MSIVEVENLVKKNYFSQPLSKQSKGSSKTICLWALFSIGDIQSCLYITHILRESQMFTRPCMHCLWLKDICIQSKNQTEKWDYNKTLKLLTYLQWCQIENQQSPVYTVNSHFSRLPDGCWKCCLNFAHLNHLYHIWELSNEVLYDAISQRVSKIRRVKFEKSKFT